MQVIKWLFRCTYFSLPCCSDLGVGGWVRGKPNIVRILKIRTQKWTVPKGYEETKLVDIFVLLYRYGTLMPIDPS